MMTSPPFTSSLARHCASGTLRGWRARTARAVTGLLLLGAVAFGAVGCGERATDTGREATSVLSTSFKPNRGLIVPVTIGGKGYHFLVDTGASFTVIDNRAAESVTRASSENQMPATFREMYDKGAVVPDGLVYQRRIRLWQPLPIKLGDYEAPVRYPWIGLDLSTLTQALGTPIDGIIGIEIFRQLTWVVDNRGGTLTVWRHGPAGEHFERCVPYQDGYGLSPAVAVNFGKEIEHFRFATGSRYSNVSAPTLAYLANQRAATPLGDTTVSATAHGVARVSEHLVSGLTFDGQSIGRLRVTKGGDNLLGMNFLARLDRYMFVPSTMEFCYEASRLGQHEPAPLRRIPVRFVDGHVELFGGSPEELGRYGLCNGDVLMEINGKRVDPSAIADVREQLSHASVGSLQLGIERDGARRTVSL